MNLRKTNSRKIFNKLLVKIFFILLLFTIILETSSFAVNELPETQMLSENIENINESNQSTNLKIQSNAVVLMDYSTGAILYSKNKNVKVYPASITKIMTAILAIENGNLSDITKASKTAISGIPSGYASAYLSEGEEMSIEYLLQAFLIHSSNEVGNVLAEYISGSIEDFVVLMNKKAKEIGCTNTNFVNTNGIHNSNHYTTANDLALIMQYCLKNSTFRSIISMPSCTIPETNKSGIRKYSNTNNLIVPSSSYYYESCIGGKTGYTSEAQNCLVSACNKNNLKLIAIVLGSPQKGVRYTDSVALYDYGYSNYSVQTIAHKGDLIDTIEIENANKETKSLDILLGNDIEALIKKTDLEKVSKEIKLNENLSAPIAENSIVGTVTYSVGDATYVQNLLASHNVEKNDSTFIALLIILILILFIIFIGILLRILKKRKKNLNFLKY